LTGPRCQLQSSCCGRTRRRLVRLEDGAGGGGKLAPLPSPSKGPRCWAAIARYLCGWAHYPQTAPRSTHRQTPPTHNVFTQPSTMDDPAVPPTPQGNEWALPQPLIKSTLSGTVAGRDCQPPESRKLAKFYRGLAFPLNFRLKKV
jgi:hypothetical protein